MPKWEYKYIYTAPSGLSVMDHNNTLLEGNLSSYLDKIGLEGWEILQILPEVGVPATITMMIFFKRQISE